MTFTRSANPITFYLADIISHAFAAILNKTGHDKLGLRVALIYRLAYIFKRHGSIAVIKTNAAQLILETRCARCCRQSIFASFNSRRNIHIRPVHTLCNTVRIRVD